jgi:hypothetical protein
MTKRSVSAKSLVARSVPFFGYLALHALIVVGMVTPRFPTSAEYFRLDFLGRDPRLWTVPLVYWCLPTDSLRVAGQAILAAGSWWVLASVASSMVHDRRVRLGLRLVVLALGVAAPIAEWNSAILGESVAISLTALLVAAWLAHAQRPRIATAISVVVATILWTFTRQDHIFIGALIAVVVFASLPRTRARTLTVSLAIALVVITALGFVTASRNKSLATVNLTAIVAERVLPNRGYLNWFVFQGRMPDTSAIRGAVGKYPPEFYLGSDPHFGPWVRTHGLHTYIRFLLTHPKYTLVDPLPYVTGEEPSLLVPPPASNPLSPDTTPSFLSPNANWARHRDVLPREIQDLLFSAGQSGDVLLLGGIAIGLAVVAWRRRVLDRRLLVPAVVLGTVLPQIYVVWLTSASELDRHAIIIAVSVRIALWLIAAYALDALLAPSSASIPNATAH